MPAKNLLQVVDYHVKGSYAKLWSIDFNNDKTCCVIARKNQYACLVGNRVIHIIHMDKVFAFLHSGNVAKSRTQTSDILSRVQSPTITSSKRIASAVVHGTRFYVAEEPITDDGQLVLHVTDFNEMVKLPNNAEPKWDKQIVSIDVNELPCAMQNLSNVKVQLFDTPIGPT